MGAVSVDIHKAQRDYKNFTLSDYNVIKYLILYRAKLDTSRNSVINIDIQKSGDIFDFNEEIICLYASLDKLLGCIKLRDKDKKFLNLIFEGHTLPDIIEMYDDYPKKTAYRILDKIIERTLEANLNDWTKCLKHK